MDKFDLHSIAGLQVNVETSYGELVTVKVIDAEVLFNIIRQYILRLEYPNLTLGELVGSVQLLEELTGLFTGFKFSPYEISWYTTTDPRDIPTKAVGQAVREGNDLVIVEVIPIVDKETK